MRLNILSDLHMGQGSLNPPSNDADVVILAGGIARPSEAVAWASGLGKPVLYVPGNHEFYGRSVGGTLALLRKLCEGTQVYLLDDEEMVLGGVRFLGSTLWTDFLLFGNGEARDAAEREAVSAIRDFSRIFLDEAMQQPFTPMHSVALFQQHAAGLESRLAQAHAGPTVVITHHALSTHSIHPRFEGSMLNANFVSDLHHLLDGDRVQLWIHGHTHDSFDYEINGTRVVCNPRGYARDGVNENARFDADFIVEI